MDPPEASIKGRCGSEAGMEGDLPHRQWGGGEEPLGLLDLLRTKVLAQRAPDDGGRSSRHVVGIPAEESGEFRDPRSRPLSVAPLKVVCDRAV